ncbi:MAG: molybdopterin cofactor-binding domain-containing protein [Bacteroidota bacterium]
MNRSNNTLNFNRRNFLRTSAAIGGGLIIGFQWHSCKQPEDVVVMPKEWTDLNAFLKIGDNGMVTIMSPNPEIGQNIKTAMPMLIAEELDIDWKKVVVEQAPLNSAEFERQVAGGSMSISHGWVPLRTVGATAKQLMINTAAKQWEVEPSTCSVTNGVVSNAYGDKLHYGELVKAAKEMDIPTDVKLKDPKDFKIIGTDRYNVDISGITEGKPLFGLDTKVDGMLYASVLRPPAFGKKLVDYDDSAAKAVTGVAQVVKFGDKVAVLADNTWAAMKGKKAIKANYKTEGKLEDTAYHDAELLKLLNKKSDKPERVDGNVDKAFAEADQVIEKVFESPFLPHNCLEPMNFYANVTPEKVELLGPIQTPAWCRQRVSKILERPEEEISVMMTRMGGGFGRRLYGDFSDEAAEISHLAKVPVMLVFSREDDMTAGTYRPAVNFRFKAAIKDGQMTAYHQTCAGANVNRVWWGSNFPAGAVENYRCDVNSLESNITTGAWRAPISNFLAFAEQAFLDEVADACGKDPIDFQLALYQRAKDNPVGKVDDEKVLQYDPEKAMGVIRLVKEKSNYGSNANGVTKGFAQYYSHNTYVAEVADIVMKDNVPVVDKVYCAIDCGIVVNPLAALNQIEGGVVDGIGHAMYGDFSFTAGQANQNNFTNYRMIRMAEAPKVESHFVKSYNDPTGLGEPTLPPAGGAVANAIHKATGNRLYKQPFVNQSEVLG